MVRKYSDYSFKQILMIILTETLENEEKKSEGWAGDLETLRELKHVLRGYNVYYTSDFTGCWVHKPKPDYIG